MTNLERIKEMSVEELAKHLCGILDCCYYKENIKKWLEREVIY